MLSDIADLVVVGGGINGVGIAADAAGRGLSVVLLLPGIGVCSTPIAAEIDGPR